MLSENPNKIISFQKKEIKKERWEEENGRRKEEVKEGNEGREAEGGNMFRNTKKIAQ